MLIPRHCFRLVLIAALALPLAAPAATRYSVATVGAAGCSARDIKLSGHVPGAYADASGTMRELGALGGKEGGSMAFDINNLGQIVGEGNSESVQRAFLYENGVLRDLTTLIDPACGWLLQEARASNDWQQIAASGCRGGQCGTLRLDPASAVPEPDTYAVLLLGLCMVGFAARRAAGVGANRTVSSSERHGAAALPFAR
ncbi:PEP-CTERM sorting domain-containing protein [Massilia frigida]|nr:PEP-CTERM sorting domain-containing protein [Massilia frigida]